MTSRLMEGPQRDLSEQAVSDYDPCAGRLAVKMEAVWEMDAATICVSE